MKKRRGLVLSFCLLVLLAFSVGLMHPLRANAASLANSKPVIDTDSAYQYKSVILKWSAVSGAKEYEVYRSVMNPATGTYGSWKKWATTKKTQITKKDTGDCRYRVRAIKGSKKSQWSDPKRIFSARAYITDMGHDGSHINFRVLITNKTKSPMGFMINAILGVQNNIYVLDNSNNVVNKISGNLVPAGGGNSIAVIVGAKKSQSIYIQSSYVSAADYAKIKKQKVLLACSFYPNPEVEPVANLLALACTTKIKESAISCR